jgi:hypothetical protein
MQLLIDHSVYTSAVGIQANSLDLPGRLLGPKGHEVKDPYPGDTIGAFVLSR